MNISKDNINGVKNLPGVNISSCIVPCTDEDNYPTHDSIYGKGGWREVRTIEERNAIPMERRKLGMAVYVTQLSKLYILKYALNDACWYEFNSIDVSDIINAAIDAGKIHVNIESCVSKGELEATLVDYTTHEEAEANHEAVKEELKKWVKEQKYLTEHQSLEGLATEEFVQESIGEAVSEIENNLMTINSDIQELKDGVEELNTFKGTTETKLGEIDSSIEKINEFISGEEGQEIEVATKASVDALDQREQEHYEELTGKYDSISGTYATKEELESLNTEFDTESSRLNSLIEQRPTATEVKTMIQNTSETFITRDYLRGFATESFVKDYIARVMDGTIKPGA